jgi:uncharacterized protein VirK/YbjX
VQVICLLFFLSEIQKFVSRCFQTIQPNSLLAAREACSLAASGYAGEPRLTIFKQQAKWAFAGAVNATAALEWFRILQTPELSTYVRLNRRLALKPMRVYVSSRWKIEKKIKVMRDTYKFIQIVGSPLQNALSRPGGVNLARFAITAESEALVTLGYDNTFRKEGELVATFTCADLGGTIISLVFSFEQKENGGWIMYVGCIQGRSGIDNKPVSKAMHGLWPKAFIVFIAQEIASALGVTTLLGVGNDIHSHKKKHVIYISSRHELSFDYDALWTEAEAIPSADGWFDLPLQLQRRSYESMKSNKRSMYSRRYAMLDSISAQIQSSLVPDS